MKIFTIIKSKLNFINKYPLIKGLFVLLFWMLVWQIIYLIINKDILVVSPIHVFFRLLELAKMNSFWNSVIFSMIRVLAGFLLGIIFGILLAVLTCYSNVAKDLLKPIISLIKATPVASFIILALVWLKSGIVPVFISTLMVIPIVWTNVTYGIIKTDKKLLEMAKVFKFNRISKIKKIFIPSIMPYFTAACTTALGFSWKAGIAAEVIGNTKNSIGSEIYKSKMYIETIDLFSFTVVVVFFSIILENTINKVMKKISCKYNFFN